MKQILILLLFLSACGGATITEEWPDGYPQEIKETKVKEVLIPEPEPILETTFSVIEGKPLSFVLNGEVHSIELFEILQERARMRIDGVSFMIGVNKTAIRSGVQLTVIELVQNAVPIPRPSAADLTVGETRETVVFGEARDFGNVSVLVDFVGLQEGVPKARIVIGDKNAILSEKEEQRIGGFRVYVHNIYFNNATAYDYADAVTVRVG